MKVLPIQLPKTHYSHHINKKKKASYTARSHVCSYLQSSLHHCAARKGDKSGVCSKGKSLLDMSAL